MSGSQGTRRIGEAFSRSRAENRAALLTYLTLGYPSPARSLGLVEAAVSAGADLIELGVPFSDPLADGPVIQRATHLALQQGTTVSRCLEMAQELRARGIAVPFVFMGYINPILAYGQDAFCRACCEAQVDGLIVPDLPPEEGSELEKACQRYGIALVYLLAPTSTPERIRMVAARSSGFVYLVSIAGVTGPRKRLGDDLISFVSRVRAVTDKPLAVGFGISTPAQAQTVAGFADGVVVGSAIVRLAEATDGSARIASLVGSLHQAMARGT